MLWARLHRDVPDDPQRLLVDHIDRAVQTVRHVHECGIATHHRAEIGRRVSRVDVVRIHQRRHRRRLRGRVLASAGAAAAATGARQRRAHRDGDDERDQPAKAATSYNTSALAPTPASALGIVAYSGPALARSSRGQC